MTSSPAPCFLFALAWLRPLLGFCFCFFVSDPCHKRHEAPGWTRLQTRLSAVCATVLYFVSVHCSLHAFEAVTLRWPDAEDADEDHWYKPSMGPCRWVVGCLADGRRELV